MHHTGYQVFLLCIVELSAAPSIRYCKIISLRNNMKHLLPKLNLKFWLSKWVTLGLLLTTVSPLYAASPQKIQRDINTIIANFKEDINIGIKVENLNTNKIIYTLNADRYYVPASNLKLFTAIAGLLYLGPKFTFDTKILANTNQVKNGVLNSDLTIKFNADPTLSSDDLARMINQLRTLDIQQIKGNVLLDNSSFDQINLGPGWMWDDARVCFSAPTNAEIINRNCYQIIIKPAQTVNQPLISSSIQRPVPIKLHISALTKPPKTASGLELIPQGENNYELIGCLAQNAKPQQLSIAVQYPRPYTEALVRQLFQKANIKITGQVKTTNLSSSQPLIALVVNKSPTLLQLVNPMLKKSDNVISNALFKTLGAKYFNTQGTWRNSAKAVQAIYSKNGVNLSKAKILDGAGLSRYNLVTPSQLVNILKLAYKKFKLPQEFISTLPISGVDGTLKHRMKQTSAQNRVLAKTGAMANTIGLSGYIKTNSKQLLAFSIIINGAPNSLANYRKLEDDICAYLAQL